MGVVRSSRITGWGGGWVGGCGEVLTYYWLGGGWVGGCGEVLTYYWLGWRVGRVKLYIH